MKDILAAVPQVAYICLDVANGYSEHFTSFVREARRDFPDKTIMVSWQAGARNIKFCLKLLKSSGGVLRDNRVALISVFALRLATW